MIALPPGFAVTKYPGYFFHIEEKRLYSIKIDGILKPIKFYKPDRFNKFHTWPIRWKTKGAYCVSVKAERRYLFIEDLLKLKIEDAIIPIRRL